MRKGAERAHGHERIWELVTLPLPNLFIIFVLNPLVIKRYAMIRAVAALDPIVMSKTIAYMKEEAKLRDEVVGKLREVSMRSGRI